mgnify:CR=1 FL=1
MSHKSEEAACVRRQGVQKLLPQISRAFVVPHALGLLTAADEGKLASAAVLLCVRPGHAFDWPAPVPVEQRLVLEDVLEPEEE